MSYYTHEQRERVTEFVEEFKELQLKYGVNLCFDREMGRWMTMLDHEFKSPAEFEDAVENDAEDIIESLDD